MVVHRIAASCRVARLRALEPSLLKWKAAQAAPNNINYNMQHQPAFFKTKPLETYLVLPLLRDFCGNSFFVFSFEKAVFNPTELSQALYSVCVEIGYKQKLAQSLAIQSC